MGHIIIQRQYYVTSYYQVASSMLEFQYFPYNLLKQHELIAIQASEYFIKVPILLNMRCQQKIVINFM